MRQKRPPFLFLFFMLLSGLSTLQAQHPLADSLTAQLKNKHTQNGELKHDSVTVMLLNELSYTLRNTDHDTAMYYAREGLHISTSFSFDYGIGLSAIRCASIHQKKGEYEQALALLDEKLPLVKALGDQELLGKIFLTQGITYKKKGDYPEAIASYLNSLKHYTNPSKKAKVYNNLAIVYSLLEDYNNALVYYKKALEVQTALNNTVQIARTHHNLSIAYTEQGKLDEAYDHLSKSLAIEAANPNSIRATKLKMELGFIEEKRENYAKAKVHYEQALIAFKANGQEEDIIYCWQSLALVYGKLNQLEQARFFYHESLSAAKKKGMQEVVKTIYLNLSILEKEHDNYQAAHDYLALHIAIKDTLLNAKKNRQIAELKEAYETEQKEQAIIQMAQEKELDGIKLEAQDKSIHLRNTILIGAGVLLVLSVLLLFVFRQKERQTRLLAKKNEEIQGQETMRLLKQQELEQFEALMAMQANERKRIADDLHDHLGNNLATIKLYFDALHPKVNIADPESKEQYQKANDLLADVCEEARYIAHNISNGKLAETGLVSAVKELANVVDVSGAIKMNVYASVLESRFPGAIEIKIYRTIQELTTNIIRHANATQASIQFTDHEDVLNIVVEDNGKGFLFDEIGQKSGMGLKGIEARIKALDGEFIIDSGKGRGTTIIINIPFPKTEPTSL